MKREDSIDAYRVALMFGICLLHSISQAGHSVPWVANMLSWCVPGFMFISGWFGIRFSVGKVLKLYGISLYCAAMFVTFDVLVSGRHSYSLLRVYNIAKGQWFLNAYAIVMCLAPMVNLAMERMTVKELYPLMLLTFGWSFATTLPISGYVPSSQGLTAYSFLTLLGVYVVARFARKTYDERGRFFEFTRNMKLLIPTLLFCLFLAAIGLGDYNSPFAIVIAGGMFFMIKRYGVPGWLGCICVWLGPSMFPIYLLHSHGQAWGYLKVIEDNLLAYPVNMEAAYILTACVVFVSGALADMPRRAVAMCLDKVK